MVETIIVLLAVASLAYGGYRYCENVKFELRSHYEVIYYMLCDLQRERFDKNKNK